MAWHFLRDRDRDGHRTGNCSPDYRAAIRIRKTQGANALGFCGARKLVHVGISIGSCDIDLKPQPIITPGAVV